MELDDQYIIQHFNALIGNRSPTCEQAKASLANADMECMLADNMLYTSMDEEILNFLYEFLDDYLNKKTASTSAAVIFTGPLHLEKDIFEMLISQKLQALQRLNAISFPLDEVSSDPQHSPQLRVKLKQQLLVVAGTYPENYRASGKFQYPCLIFKPADVS